MTLFLIIFAIVAFLTLCVLVSDKKYPTAVLLLLASAVMVYFYFFNTYIFLLIFSLVCFILCPVILYKTLNKSSPKKLYKNFYKRWREISVANFETIQVMKNISPYIDKIYESDTNSQKYREELPYGRMTYFLNFFNSSLDQEEPLYFSPKRSLNNDELREYGTLITTSGVYISHQVDKSENGVLNVFLPFNAVIGTQRLLGNKKNPPSLRFFYANGDYMGKMLNQRLTSIPIENLQELYSSIVGCGISKSMYENKVYNYEDVIREQEEKFWNENTSQGYAKAFEAAGVGATLGEHAKMYDAVRNNMNQIQGHGTAAEYANTVIDKLQGKNAVQIGGDNAKDGADRVVTNANGQTTLIQSKYCQTPRETLKSAFDDHDYPLDMKIEVPRDQYNDCVNILQRKIDNGDYESKGIMKGDRAEKYLKKGHITYQDSKNIAIAGRVEGIFTDIGGAIVCSAGAGSITALLTFAVCKWNGMETKDAALESLKTGVAVIGKSTIIYVAAMQLSRKTMVADIASVFAKSGAKTVTNPVYKISENIAAKISKSALAKTAVGQKMGLASMTGKAVISGTVVAVVTFGPDIVRALRGRISFKQLLKNSAVGASGIAGAAIGQAVIPIPILGAMIGGAVAGFAAKKALDHFVEDDAIAMFAILKEEFIDVVPSSGLNEKEFNEVVSLTISNSKLTKLLQEMYAYGNSREYARENIVCLAVQGVLAKRAAITEEMYDDGLTIIVSDTDYGSEPEEQFATAT